MSLVQIPAHKTTSILIRYAKMYIQLFKSFIRNFFQTITRIKRKIVGFILSLKMFFYFKFTYITQNHFPKRIVRFIGMNGIKSMTKEWFIAENIL